MGIMHIPPINGPQPTFGVRPQKPILGRAVISCLPLRDDVVQIHKNRNFQDTLLHFKDSTGKWIKSKLKMFKGNKVINSIYTEK